jgi:hypothetical protein
MDAPMRTKLLTIGFVAAAAVVGLPTHARADAGAEADSAGADALAQNDAAELQDTSLTDASEPPDSETTGPGGGLDGAEFEDVIVADGGDSTDAGLSELADSMANADGSPGDVEEGASSGGCSTSRPRHADLFAASGVMLAGAVVGWARRRRRRAL